MKMSKIFIIFLVLFNLTFNGNAQQISDYEEEYNMLTKFINEWDKENKKLIEIRAEFIKHYDSLRLNIKVKDFDKNKFDSLHLNYLNQEVLRLKNQNEELRNSMRTLVNLIDALNSIELIKKEED